MNTTRSVLVLGAFALLFALVFAQLAEAKTKIHRRHVFDRYHRHGSQDRDQRASSPAFQRGGQDRSGSEWDSTCFSLSYLQAQYSCSGKGGGGGM
jgi:hypothetical protein